MCDHTKIFVIVESELIFGIQGVFFYFFPSWDMMQGYEIGFRVSEKKSLPCACTCAHLCFNLRDQKEGNFAKLMALFAFFI